MRFPICDFCFCNAFAGKRRVERWRVAKPLSNKYSTLFLFNCQDLALFMRKFWVYPDFLSRLYPTMLSTLYPAYPQAPLSSLRKRGSTKTTQPRHFIKKSGHRAYEYAMPKVHLIAGAIKSAACAGLSPLDCSCHFSNTHKSGNTATNQRDHRNKGEPAIPAHRNDPDFIAGAF